MNAEQFWSRIYAHLIDDERTPIAALRYKLLVPKALHQHNPGACNVGDILPGGGRSARVSVARH